MTAIEQFDPGFTNASNQIAVQIYIRNISAGNNFSVSRLEVDAVLDSVAHLEFDLTHDFGLGLGLSGRAFPVPPDAYSMAREGGAVGEWWTVLPTGTSTLDLSNFTDKIL